MRNAFMKKPTKKQEPLRISPNDYSTLEEALNRRTIISAKVLRCVKGGFVVQTANTRAFLPCSLLDARPVRDVHAYVGKTIDVHVQRLAPEDGILTVSRRSVIELQMGQERKALIDALKVGARVQGVVSSIADFGAFVDIGGLQGLIPVGSWSGKLGTHPSRFVSAGQLVNVAVKALSTDPTGKLRISLSKPQFS